MKKLIVTIPAFNEEKTIAEVISSIPRKIPGISEVEVLVMSDGSTDNTEEVAKKAGADYVFRNKKQLGLAKTFNKAIHKAAELGADIVVNTDADNQYDQQEIPQLIQPILDGKADMVSGDRQVMKLDWMIPAKKYGNVAGSALVRYVTGEKINDASSGFRAFTRECVQKFSLLAEHTYTHETIIQASHKDLIIAEVPITFKRRTSGTSRLISNVRIHVQRSLAVIFRSIMMYKAFSILTTFGSILVFAGLLIGVRFLYLFISAGGTGHIQSLILSAILIIVGFNTISLGVLADLIVQNRKLIEKIHEIEYNKE